MDKQTQAFIGSSCSIREPEREDISYQSDEIDFPCSYSWRSFYEETLYGRYLPSIELPQEEPKVEHITRVTTVIGGNTMQLLNRIVALENQSHTNKKSNRYNKYIS